MNTKIFNQLLIVSFIGVSLGGCLGSKPNNLVNSNTEEQKAQSDIQEFANNYIKHKEDDGFSAISVTAQCNGFNDSQPATAYAGIMGRDDNRPIQSNSVWQIASNTKSFTSIVIIQLADEYKDTFSIEDDITKWFPEYTYWQDPITHKGPTVHQLMNMTSGIPNNNTAEFFKYYADHPYAYISPVEVITYSKKSLDFASGSNWRYSNTGYNILSQLIPRVTGKNYHGQDPYQVEVTNRIINKLGLKHTYVVQNISTEFTDKSNIVHGYFNVDNSVLPKGLDYSLWALSWSTGSGNIISTTEDMTTYYRALYESDKLLNEAQFKKLSSFVEGNGGEHPSQPVDSPDKSSTHGAYALGIGAFSFTVEKAKDYANITKHLDKYNLVYSYLGSQPGFFFYYVYNKANATSVVVSVNSSTRSDNIQRLTYSVLDYLDDKCK